MKHMVQAVAVIVAGAVVTWLIQVGLWSHGYDRSRRYE